MEYHQIERTVATRRSIQQIEASLSSALNNVRIDERGRDRLVGRSGSRILYRLFGAYVWPGSTHFPIRFVITKHAGEAPQTAITVDTDMGPYLLSVPRAKKLYEDTADRLIAAVSSGGAEG